jgi:hypothetical protein
VGSLRVREDEVRATAHLLVGPTWMVWVCLF